MFAWSGIYGTACVWAISAKHAKNVYAKLLLDSNHPNLQYLTTKHLFCSKTPLF